MYLKMFLNSDSYSRVEGARALVHRADVRPTLEHDFGAHAAGLNHLADAIAAFLNHADGQQGGYEVGAIDVRTRRVLAALGEGTDVGYDNDNLHARYQATFRGIQQQDVQPHLDHFGLGGDAVAITDLLNGDDDVT